MLTNNFSGQQLRDFRQTQKVSQAKLAKETLIVQAKISVFELGKGELSAGEKELILNFFSNSGKVEKVAKAKKKITKESSFSINPLDVDRRRKKYTLSKKTEKYVKDLDNIYDKHINSKKDLKAISLFSGCGGLCLGFSAAGVRIAGFIEKDKHISQIYRDNFSSTPQLANDITSLSHKDIEQYKDSIGEIDIVIGGPPCQGFSLSGKRDKSDARNKLFENYLDFVTVFKPKIALLENVQLLTSMKDENGNHIKDLIIKKFQDLNYKITYFDVNAKDYGVPQSRARVFFLAIRNDIQSELGFPDAEGNNLTFGDACSDLEYLESGESSNIDRLHFAVNHPAHVLEWLWNVPEGNSAHDNTDEYLRPPSGYNTTYKRQVWNEEGSTVQTTFGMISGCRNVHPVATRSLTIREAARIQSFPDKFVFNGKVGTVRTAIGNAVPPLLSYKIAKYLTNILKSGQ
ncbi:DNA (cytosine-5-)-methyltransferase [Acinetobacter sp. WCHAc060042]|uniref:Cytosine-specific methyltransferase n=1 Tax=Acinetobacter calcoaceticus TaxID=471 RepID=E3VX93_ACICA|nr:DNA (cytosine-5-)-methyltransferase [Acinetobacter sp. WCHAc060042]ADO24174.1 M.AclI [Acinetobacter calcoaceticus]